MADSPHPGRLRRLILLLCALATLGALARAPAREGALSAEGRAKIEAAVREEMVRQRVPGLSAALALDGRVAWTAGFGVADLENAVPATPATVYRLASVSKPVAATAVMQLAERGKLDLDAPIQRYVPAFPEKQWPVTARQLLGHLGGIRHYRPGELESTRHYRTLEEGLAIFKDDPLLHEPGAKYLYTTYGYNLLGCAVENAAGVDYMEYLKERIFRPAGMDRCRADDVFAIIPHRAQGYRRAPEGELRNSGLTDTSYKIPGGGLCANVEDVARFGIAVQNGSLLKEKTREQMWTRQETRAGEPTPYGLGWSVGEHAGRREIAHGGAQQRVSTYLYMRPEQRCVVVLLCNLEGTKLPDLARRIASLARE